MKHTIRGLAAAVVAVGTMTMPALASDPLGAFCIVEKVVFEPGDCPVRAQVWGACAVANPSNGRFEKAAKGYFYYSVPTGNEEVARAEWMDLKAAAGTGAVPERKGHQLPHSPHGSDGQRFAGLWSRHPAKRLRRRDGHRQ